MVERDSPMVGVHSLDMTCALPFSIGSLSYLARRGSYLSTMTAQGPADCRLLLHCVSEVISDFVFSGLYLYIILQTTLSYVCGKVLIQSTSWTGLTSVDCPSYCTKLRTNIIFSAEKAIHTWLLGSKNSESDEMTPFEIMGMELILAFTTTVHVREWTETLPVAILPWGSFPGYDQSAILLVCFSHSWLHTNI